MKATSSLIMWLTLLLVLGLSMVLALVLLLLAELYCSPLLGRHRHPPQVTTPNATTTDNNSTTVLSHSPSTLHSLLYPADDIEAQLPETQNQKKTRLRDGCSAELVYISNPIFDGENGRGSRGDDAGTPTPFETPDSSPSRLETESSGDDDEVSTKVLVTLTPPLAPMKKLPADACSVCLKDVRSLGTSGSDTNGVTTSSSLTPCTSPSL